MGSAGFFEEEISYITKLGGGIIWIENPLLTYDLLAESLMHFLTFISFREFEIVEFSNVLLKFDFLVTLPLGERWNLGELLFLIWILTLFETLVVVVDGPPP